MVPWWMYIIAFLSGSIPTGLIVARFRGIDIRSQGSGNIGATNVGRVLGRKWGIGCMIFDALKGFVPVVFSGTLAQTIGTREMPVPLAFSWLGVGFAAVLGHIFCPWLNFKGGKGVATSLGVCLGFWPAMTLPMATVFLTWLIMVWRFHYVSVGSIVGAAMLPIYTLIGYIIWETNNDPNRAIQIGWPFILVALAMATVVIAAHRANIARLRAGTETKVSVPVAKL